MSRIEEALAKASQQQATHAHPLAQDPASPLAHQPLVDPTGQCDEKLVVLNAPDSPEAEEFRKLKEALLKETKSHYPENNVILVTSAGRNEGKTLISCNLAVSLAQEYDHTMLLVDADLRMPSCSRCLGLPTQEKGLSDCLVNGENVSQALVKTGIGKLVLLPAGKSVKDPMEIFSSNAMRQLVMELKHRYSDRIILIDTPPVLMFAETRALAGLVDGIILVVREGESSLEDVKESLDLLDNKVVGLVYNGTDYTQPCDYSYYTKKQQ